MAVDQESEHERADREVTRLYTKVTYRKERGKTSKRERRNAFPRYGPLFSANEKQTEKSRLTSILRRSIDRVCLPLLFHFISPFSLPFAHNSQDTSHHSFHECNKSYRKRERERGGVKLPWSEHPGRTLCSSGDAQLLLVHGPGQSRATLNYLPDAIFRREEKLRLGFLLGEISYDRSKTNSSREVQNQKPKCLRTMNASAVTQAGHTIEMRARKPRNESNRL